LKRDIDLLEFLGFRVTFPARSLGGSGEPDHAIPSGTVVVSQPGKFYFSYLDPEANLPFDTFWIFDFLYLCSDLSLVLFAPTSSPHLKFPPVSGL